MCNKCIRVKPKFIDCTKDHHSPTNEHKNRFTEQFFNALWTIIIKGLLLFSYSLIFWAVFYFFLFTPTYQSLYLCFFFLIFGALTLTGTILFILDDYFVQAAFFSVRQRRLFKTTQIVFILFLGHMYYLKSKKQLFSPIILTKFRSSEIISLVAQK